jgi:hypothetical protein
MCIAAVEKPSRPGIVFGVSMAPTNVRVVLVKGENAERHRRSWP